MKATRKYLGGMAMADAGVRNYEYTILTGPHKNKVFQSQVVTPKYKGEWGQGFESFLVNGEWISYEDFIQYLEQ